MSEPATEAGRRLLYSVGPWATPDMVAAVEHEARADLAARIVAAVRDLPPIYAATASGWAVDSAAVLRAIREASDDRRA